MIRNDHEIDVKVHFNNQLDQQRIIVRVNSSYHFIDNKVFLFCFLFVIYLPGAPQSAQTSFPGLRRISLKARVALSFADISASECVIPPLWGRGRGWDGGAE